MLAVAFTLTCNHDDGGRRHPVARLAAAKQKTVVRDIRKKNKLALQQRRQRSQSPPKPTAD